MKHSKVRFAGVFTSLVLASISCLALAGAPVWAQATPAPTPSPTPTPPDPNRLVLALPAEMTAPLAKTVNELVTKFNGRQSKTKFTVEVIAFESLARLAEIRPDFAIVDEADVQVLVGNPQLTDAIEGVAQGWFSARKFLLNLLSSTKCDNKVCSIPFQRDFPVWYYNKDLYTDPAFAASWSKLSLKISSYSDTAKQVAGVAVPLSGPNTLAYWNGLGLSPLTGGRYATPVENALDWATKTAKSKPAPSSWLPALLAGSPDVAVATEAFRNGKTAVLLGHASQFSDLKAAVKFKLGYSIPGGTLGWFGSDLVTFKRKANAIAPRWINEFLDHLYRPENWSALVKAAPSLPVHRLHLESPFWRKDIAMCPLLSEALYRSPKPMGLERIKPEKRTEWNELLWNLVSQPRSPEEIATRGRELKPILENLLSTKAH